MCVLITGASGFLGKILLQSISDRSVITLGRYHGDIIADLEKEIPLLPQIDLIVHAAGKAHMVPKTNEEIQDFFNVNVKGTKNLLLGLEKMASMPRAFIFISSVAVYGKEAGLNIKENCLLEANDPYGKSKIEAEQLITDWCNKNKVICTILRLPLIAGPNPPGNLGAMVQGVLKGYYFNIAGGKAKKSIVLAEDVAAILPMAAKVGGIFNLTDGYHPSFYELSVIIAKQMNKKASCNIPLWLAKIVANIGDLIGEKAPLNSKKLNKINSNLTFDDSKARSLLNWNPALVLERFII
jgi:nucleoside-diphosphate-sugar epimerase